MSYKFDFFKYSLLVFSFIFLALVLFNILSPNEAFAMQPDTTQDYYGNKEYTAPDSYGQTHNPATTPISSGTAVVDDSGITTTGDLYGTQPPHETDWYAHNHPNVRSPVKPDSSTFALYLSIKRRAYWYVWKRYSNEYANYSDLKRSWDPNNSIRKEIFKDIKSFFKK